MDEKKLSILNRAIRDMVLATDYQEIIIVGFNPYDQQSNVQVITMPERPLNPLMQDMLLQIKKITAKQLEFKKYHKLNPEQNEGENY